MNSLFGNIFNKYNLSSSIENNHEEAYKDIKGFLEQEDLTGLDFLDAGCGVGLFSFAANKLNAKSITSFDIDAIMVENTLSLSINTKALNWRVLPGSILDKKFLNDLGTFDYVYCWGCTHHTGSMWEAIANISDTVRQGGHIYLGIYNNASAFGFWDDGRFGSSQLWLKIKKFLNKKSPFFKQIVLRISFLVYKVLSLRSTYKYKNYNARSMNFMVSIEDWLFGHPYEYASVDEVFNYMTKKGFTLKRIKSNIGLRTNCYLFQKD